MRKAFTSWDNPIVTKDLLVYMTYVIPIISGDNGKNLKKNVNNNSLTIFKFRYVVENRFEGQRIYRKSKKDSAHLRRT